MENGGDAPGLGDAAARTVGGITVEDLRDASDTGFREVLPDEDAHVSEQERLRFPPVRGGSQKGQAKGKEKPWPDRAAAMT